jgi:hypothetical protein
MDMNAAVSLFVSQRQSSETRRSYAQDLARWQSWLDKKQLSPQIAVAYRDYLSGKYASATAARAFHTVRVFYRWLQSAGIVASNPFDGIEAPKKVKNLTPKVPADADIEALVAASLREDAPARYAAVIALLLNGLRASEVRMLRKDAIEQTDYGTILRVVGKGVKERLVPATSESIYALQRYWSDAGSKEMSSVWALPDTNGEMLTVRQVQHAVYKCAEWAGIHGMHAHALRHHYATRLIRNGAGVLQVSKLLGHSRADTTQVYVTLDLADLVEAASVDPRAVPDKPRLVAIA